MGRHTQNAGNGTEENNARLGTPGPPSAPHVHCY